MAIYRTVCDPKAAISLEGVMPEWLASLVVANMECCLLLAFYLPHIPQGHIQQGLISGERCGRELHSQMRVCDPLRTPVKECERPDCEWFLWAATAVDVMVALLGG